MNNLTQEVKKQQTNITLAAAKVMYVYQLSWGGGYRSVTVYVRQWPGFLWVHNSPIKNVKNQVKDDLRNTPLRFFLLGTRKSQRHRELQAA
jgi:hypothetical protein